MQVDQALDQRQAQPRALVVAGKAVLRLDEGFADKGEFFRRNADSGVADNKPESAVLDRGVDIDDAAGFGELDGVA